MEQQLNSDIDCLSVSSSLNYHDGKLSERSEKENDSLSSSSSVDDCFPTESNSKYYKLLTSDEGNTIRHFDPPLIAGEKIQCTALDVTYMCPYTKQTKGILTITNYKLYFHCSQPTTFPSIEIPLGLVSRIQKGGGQLLSRGESSYGLEIFCKDIRNLAFRIKCETQLRSNIYETLQQYSFPLNNELPIFAFVSEEKFDENGWTVYDHHIELKRLGVPNEMWKVSNINENYKLCDSYPAIIAVPSQITDEELKQVAAFRSRNRIPVLSWIHPESQATITRASQPLVGLNTKRCRFDERYIQLIMDANAQSHKLFILDARPCTNAMATMGKGGGYESEDAYQNADIIFLDIPNIHTMRSSFRRLKEVCFPIMDETKWLSGVENTQWLKHIKCILAGACRIVDKVENHKTSVLVHCSDGWDRTTQLIASAMVLLDPYYRTIRGFEVLIEKEWLSFGHKFQQRVGHGKELNSDEDDRSPIFLQFMDCVWQMMKVFPNAFEFHDKFLITILDHSFSCRFGTFLYNSEKERFLDGNVKQKTVSIWSLINCNLDLYKNPFYQRVPHCLDMMPTSRYIQLWKGLYCRFNPNMRPQETIYKKLRELLTLREQLEKKHAHMKNEGKLRISDSNTMTYNSIYGLTASMKI